MTTHLRHIDPARFRFEAIDRGLIELPWILRSCRLKILMVVDGYPGNFLNVSFSNSYFGLSAVLDTLRDNPEWWAKFEVTRAHRQIDSFKPDPATEPDLHDKYGPHYENFRFAGPGMPPGFNINEYDQIWLFGSRANENDSDRLRDDELQALADWMDNHQGGLFATGDHADLGASLCSRVPRAGSMRKWTSADGVPQPTGLNRHDTLLKGHNSVYTFNDESDDLPMNIRLKRYPLLSWGRWFRNYAPHPIFCGIDGPIDVLPDHPHEGWVNEDSDVDLTANIAVTGQPEYPSAGSVQAKPEVIAWARVQGDHTNTSDLNKGAANGKEFGAVGAYDGHRSNVGRVVVDSTWHHWFDVNLTGRPTDGGDLVDPVPVGDPKAEGFLFSPAGVTQYKRIQNYFRNVALWLASPGKQRCMFLRAMWGVINRYHLVEQLHPRLPLYELGMYARDAIGRRAGHCTIRQFIFPYFPEIIWERFIPLDDPRPCLSCPPWEVFETLLVGGIAREMLELAYKYRDDAKGAPEDQIAQCAAQGLRTGLSELESILSESDDKIASLRSDLSVCEKTLPDAESFLGGDSSK